MRLPELALHAATFTLGTFQIHQHVVEPELLGLEPSLQICTHVGLPKLPQLPNACFFGVLEGSTVIFDRHVSMHKPCLMLILKEIKLLLPVLVVLAPYSGDAYRMHFPDAFTQPVGDCIYLTSISGIIPRGDYTCIQGLQTDDDGVGIKFVDNLTVDKRLSL